MVQVRTNGEASSSGCFSLEEISPPSYFSLEIFSLYFSQLEDEKVINYG